MILQRYIGFSLLKGWVVVLFTLVPVFSLLAFVDELDHIGSRYRIIDALRFVLYTIPQRTLDLSPVIALLGTLIALATLARHSELIAMRSTGITQRHFLRAILVPATALVLTLGLSAEFITAPLYQNAELHRNKARSGKRNLLDGEGHWLNEGLRYLNVRTLRLGQIPTDITLYEFQPDGRLALAVHADFAQVSKDRDWTLINVEYKALSDDRLVTRHLDEYEMGRFWSRDEFAALSLSMAGMSPSQLYRYARYLDSTEQNSERIRLAFWKHVTAPLTSGAMVLLATPIGATWRSQRQGGFGRRIALGALVGILLYLATQIIHTTGLLLQLSAAITTLLPVLAILSVSWFLLSRMR